METSYTKKCYFCDTPNDLVGPTIKYCQKCYDRNLKISEESAIADLLYLSSIDEITDKIYLGNFYGSININELKAYNITHVLVCACAMHFQFPSDFVYKRIDMFDHESENLMYYLTDAIDFIENSEKVYVHCQAGISRSASIVIAYLMWKNKMSYVDARALVKSKRRNIYPNYGFEKTLKDFENLLKDNNNNY